MRDQKIFDLIEREKTVNYTVLSSSHQKTSSASKCWKPCAPQPKARPMLLAVDTATATASIALYDRANQLLLV